MLQFALVVDPLASSSTVPPPTTIALGRYTPIARLGKGGMAEVFLAIARGPMGFNKLTVIKRLRNSEDAAHVQMFLDEARLAARLNHPNIVHTYEVGQAGASFFIAMEYLEGQTVRQIAAALASRGQWLSDPLVAYIAAHALKGLHHAHELCDFDGKPLGVVHRDVSPQNLFVTYTGEVKLLDFGIAKARGNATETETGVLKGKVRYMAPEQVNGRSIDRRLDVFAFGVVMWELLARRPMFEGEPVTILKRIGAEDAPSVRSVRPDVSPELDTIVLGALRREPGDRYATADAMRGDLEHFLRGHDAAALEKELIRLMNDLFADTRDDVHQRIRSFLARVSAEEVPPSGTGLSTSSELPLLLGADSAARSVTVSTPPHSIRPSSPATGVAVKPLVRRRPFLVLAFALFGVAVGASAVALLWMRRDTPGAATSGVAPAVPATRAAAPAPAPVTSVIAVEQPSAPAASAPSPAPSASVQPAASPSAPPAVPAWWSTSTGKAAVKVPAAVSAAPAPPPAVVPTSSGRARIKVIDDSESP